LQAYVYRLPEAEQFISHDNGIFLPWERVFMKVTWTWTVLTWTVQTWSFSPQEITERLLTPITSWIEYFSKKMNR
jgi:hypothetical protein